MVHEIFRVPQKLVKTKTQSILLPLTWTKFHEIFRTIQKVVKLERDEHFRPYLNYISRFFFSLQAMRVHQHQKISAYLRWKRKIGELKVLITLTHRLLPPIMYQVIPTVNLQPQSVDGGTLPAVKAKSGVCTMVSVIYTQTVIRDWDTFQLQIMRRKRNPMNQRSMSRKKTG